MYIKTYKKICTIHGLRLVYHSLLAGDIGAVVAVEQEEDEEHVHREADHHEHGRRGGTHTHSVQQSGPGRKHAGVVRLDERRGCDLLQHDQFILDVQRVRVGGGARGLVEVRGDGAVVFAVQVEGDHRAASGNTRVNRRGAELVEVLRVAAAGGGGGANQSIHHREVGVVGHEQVSIGGARFVQFRSCDL